MCVAAKIRKLPAQARQRGVLHRQSISPLKGILKATQIFAEAQTQLYCQGKSAPYFDKLPENILGNGFLTPLPETEILNRYESPDGVHRSFVNARSTCGKEGSVNENGP